MAEVLTPEAYQQLIDRGWRRSGRWLYMPINERTCCQLITVRLNVHNFQPNKEQRRALRKWEAYLGGAPLARDKQPSTEQPQQQHAGHQNQGQQAQEQEDEQQEQAQGDSQPASSPLEEHPDGVQFPAQGSRGTAHAAGVLGQSVSTAAAALPSAGSGDFEESGSSMDTRSAGRVQDAGAASQPRGASPKRPHEDIEDGNDPALQASRQPYSSAGASLDAGGLSSKRLRGGSEAADAPGGWWGSEGLEGSSPTAQLASHMQYALWEPRQQAQQAQSRGPHGPISTAGTSDPQFPEQHNGREIPSEAAIASSLQAALQQCVEEGLVPGPPAQYPAARVQQPTAKQRKLLAADVAYTSPYALAVAGAAKRATAAAAAAVGNTANSKQGTPLNAEAVADVIVQHAVMPHGMEVRANKGHLNFHFNSSNFAGSGKEALPGAEAAGVIGARSATKAATAAPAASAAADGGSRAATAAAAAALPGSGPAATKARQGPATPAEAGSDGAAGAAAEAARAVGAATEAVPRGVRRHLEFTMVRSDPSVIPVEFDLYKKYQVVHHGDPPGEVTASSFKRFLCDSPLRLAPPEEYPPGACPPCGFGSFHQQYWLDGRLVMVGVVDILPSCLSSVYLFWDPDLGPLSLGKVSALKEIDWVAQASQQCPSLRYYYLGFYLHNCHRMRYKGDYAPADLLCPKYKCWVPLDRCRGALEQGGMVALSELPGALEGLGEEHLVSAGGEPMVPPAWPTPEELSAVRLFIQPNPLERGQAVQLRQV
ncbi:hypothetical protein N2152v2_002811 [Parachlorella kessleri]